MQFITGILNLRTMEDAEDAGDTSSDLAGLPGVLGDKDALGIETFLDSEDFIPSGEPSIREDS